MLGSRVYTQSTHSFFDELATLFINLASFNAATESFTNASFTRIPSSPEHTLNLYGSVVHATFPIHTLMHGVVRNHWPSELHLTFAPREARPSSIPNGVQLQSDAIANLIVQLVGTTFLKYYERTVGAVKLVHPTGPRTWPDVWRFAWLLRNAIAHGDRWKLDDQSFPTTSWHGVTVSHVDTANAWFNLSKYIGGGDVLLLLEELDRSRLALQAGREA